MNPVVVIIFGALLIYGIVNRDIEYEEPTYKVKQNVGAERYKDHK